MKLIYILFAIIFEVLLLNSCKERKHNVVFFDHKIDSLKKTLNGEWGGLNEYPPVWNIKMDSIYYYDRSQAYSYKIVNNDLIINLPASKGILKNIFVINDTIFFLDEQGNQIKGYRAKKPK